MEFSEWKRFEPCSAPKFPGDNRDWESLPIGVRLAPMLNEGVIRTHQRQQGLWGPEPHVFQWVSLCWSSLNQENERAESVLHARESLCGLLPSSLKKLHLEETQTQRGRTWKERWSLHRHMRPWDFHKSGKRDHECQKQSWQRISNRWIWKLRWRNTKK